MVNEGCLYKCPFRKFHFNVVSHYSKELDNKNKAYLPDFFKFCSAVIIEDNSQILKSGWIRPEDVHKYSEITRFYKVVDRGAMGSRVLRATRAYLEESWDGDLLDLLGSSFLSFSIKYGAYLDNKKLGELGFFEKVTSCDRNCTQCNYCKNITNKLLMLGGLTKEKLRDMGRNREADELEMKEKVLNPT